MTDNESYINLSTGLSATEIRQYARQLALPELGVEGQKRLKAARVLAVGAGGLGSPLLLYLAAAGVGMIGIVDGDRVDHTNLHRQVLYTADDVGKMKVEAARKRLSALNPHIQFETHPTFLTRHNALEIIERYDIVADGSDNFATRYLVNDACVLRNKANVHAAIFKLEGQVAVFNALRPDGSRSANYRDLHPIPPPPSTVPNCAEAGVLGVLPGIIGAIQANEVIKMITGIGTPLIDRVLHFDSASLSVQVFKIMPRPDTVITALPDDEALFCTPAEIPSMSAEQLSQLLAKGTDIQLIDVREPHEHACFNLGGILLPLNEIAAGTHLLTDKLTIVYCERGQRSREAAAILKKLTPLREIYHLEGGITAFKIQ